MWYLARLRTSLNWCVTVRARGDCRTASTSVSWVVWPARSAARTCSLYTPTSCSSGRDRISWLPGRNLQHSSVRFRSCEPVYLAQLCRFRGCPVSKSVTVSFRSRVSPSSRSWKVLAGMMILQTRYRSRLSDCCRSWYRTRKTGCWIPCCGVISNCGPTLGLGWCSSRAG